MEYFSLPELQSIIENNTIKLTSKMRKKELYNFLNEKNLIPKVEINPHILRCVKKRGHRVNQRKVKVTNIETKEENEFPSIYKMCKFYNINPHTAVYWDGKLWKDKYKIEIENN